MDKKHYELSCQYVELNNHVKDALSNWMKELGHIRFNTPRKFPFEYEEGGYLSVEVSELKYDEEYFGDVTAIDTLGREWSVQEECSLSGCMELLYYVEERAWKYVE